MATAPRPCGDFYSTGQVEEAEPDPFYIPDAEWARVKAQSDATSAFIRSSAARIKAKREASRRAA
jgi:hypothetical protein